MAKEWDNLMKLLAEANPQHLVSLVLPGANYLGGAFTDLQAQSQQIQADVMYNVLWKGVEVILHIEFQRRHDEDMGRRVWEYQEDDRQWLQRRFEMLHDILEESWAYQEIKQKGLFEGRQEGLQQGRNEERQRELQQQRQALTTYVELHFPTLVPLLKTQTDTTDDPEVLQRLLINLFMTGDEEEAKHIILSASEQIK